MRALHAYMGATTMTIISHRQRLPILSAMGHFIERNAIMIAVVCAMTDLALLVSVAYYLCTNSYPV